MGGMSTGGDDIERLLREVDALNAGGAPAGGSAGKEVASRGSTPQPKGRKGKEVEESGGSAGGRVAFALLAAVVVGVIGAFVGMFLGPIPLLATGFWATGLGAAFGAFLTALVAGPPRWFDS